MHDRKQDVSLDFWRIVVPDDKATKSGELYRSCIAHRTALTLVFKGLLVGFRKSFYWTRYAGRHKAVCGELSGVSDGEI